MLNTDEETDVNYITKRRICVCTGSRAEYGLLLPIMKDLSKSERYKLQTVVFASHIPQSMGGTLKEIEKDGFNIDATVDMLLASNTSCGISISTGVGIIGMAQTFERLKPDLVIYLGDRYEGICVATCCVLQNIPLAHIFGGDVTEGAFDDKIRHAISKMASLHFPASDMSAKRLKQMGEDPSRIYCCGHPGLQDFTESFFLNKIQLQQFLNFDLPDNFIVCIVHPETAFPMAHSVTLLKNVLDAIKDVCTQSYETDEPIHTIFIGSNADTNSNILINMIQSFVAENEFSMYMVNLARKQFASLVKLSRCVIGNSSAGLLEVPALHIPTVNVGDRQKGRQRSVSIIDTGTEYASIKAGLVKALTMDKADVSSTYEILNTSELIISSLNGIQNFSDLLIKTFYADN